MKYRIGQPTVAAVYDMDGSRNPFIEALPESLSEHEFVREIQSFPPCPSRQADLSLTERKRGIAAIQTLFVPMDYMYCVYDQLWRMIQSTYHTRSSKQNVIRINALFANETNLNEYGTQPQSASLLGSAGLGKTSTIKRCLCLIPQVIEHEQYLHEPFFCKQVLYLFCECPSDCSIKTMSFNIVKALDDAVGSNHLDYLMKMRSTATSSIATYIKVLCMTYNIGLICVDEIQNLVIEAKRTNRIKPMIRFLTELTNDSATAIYFSGTMLAETVFEQEPYLKRRTRGLRLLPFKNDGAYRDFLAQLWPYQYTETRARMTDRIANVFYDYSGGVPAYIAKLSEESQVQALSYDLPCINEQIIRNTAELLAIRPQKIAMRGKFLSEFHCAYAQPEEPIEKAKINDGDQKSKRLYANQRGRKAQERDKGDLIAAFHGNALQKLLREQKMLVEVSIC